MKTTLPRSLQHGRFFVQPEVIITGLPGIWNKNQTLSKMCHVCVYYGVIIKKWTTFNKGEMAFLKFFCLFKQLKTPRHCASRLPAASLQLVLILQIHKKRRQMHFLRVKERAESIRKRGEGMMGLGDEANGRRRARHNFPLLTSAACSTLQHCML